MCEEWLEVHFLFGLELYMFLSFELVMLNKQSWEYELLLKWALNFELLIDSEAGFHPHEIALYESYLTLKINEDMMK